jgi:hypothetical protein
MTREQAINYLYSSGMSSTQVKAVEQAFTCYVIDRIKADIRELATADTVDTLVDVSRIMNKYKEGNE